MTQFTIKKVSGIKEEDTLRELQDQCFGPKLYYPTSKGLWWIVYNENNKPVGFAGLKILQYKESYLCRAGILKEARGNNLQVRLIKIREKAAKRLDCNLIVTDTSKENFASANNLIKAGFQLYDPVYRWGFKDGLYWKKELT